MPQKRNSLHCSNRHRNMTSELLYSIERNFTLGLFPMVGLFFANKLFTFTFFAALSVAAAAVRSPIRARFFPSHGWGAFSPILKLRYRPLYMGRPVGRCFAPRTPKNQKPSWSLLSVCPFQLKQSSVEPHPSAGQVTHLWS